MAGFVEPRNGRYRARFTPPGGKEVNETFDRAGDANDWLDRQRGDAVRGQWIDPRGGKTLFEDHAANWSSNQVHVRESTDIKDEANLRNHILPTFTGRQLRAISRSSVQNWVTSLTHAGLAPTTIAGIYGLMVRIMLSAVHDKLIHDSPCLKINLPEVDNDAAKIPELGQLEVVTARLPGAYRRVVPLIAGTGLRQGEAFGLTVDRIDFLGRSLRVDRQLQRRPRLQAQLDEHGKLPKSARAVPLDGGLFLVPPKTKRSTREIPMSRHTAMVLSAQIEEFPPSHTGLVFVTSTGRPVARQTLDDTWERATRKRSGAQPAEPDPGEYRNARDPVLGGYFTIHDVRHFHASMLIAKGLPVTRVAACLGHTEEECLRTYAHLWPDDEHRVREAVDSVLMVDDPAELSRPQHGLS